MEFEKRTQGQDSPAPGQEASPPPAGRKPVLVYILILFIVAFLLMSLSFFMHQRSNSEALGELQHSVSALQEIQATQDQNVQLQKELDETAGQRDDLKDQLAASQEETLQVQKESDALLSLYLLQQQFAAEDFDTCRNTLQHMEDQHLVECLPKKVESGATSPADRYQQIKESVLNP